MAPPAPPTVSRGPSSSTPTPCAVDSTINRVVANVCASEMTQVWGKSQRPTQVRTMANHLHPSRLHGKRLVNTAIVLGAGSGKSLSCQTVGSLLPGRVVVCVHPLLSLSADQQSRSRRRRRSPRGTAGWLDVMSRPSHHHSP